MSDINQMPSGWPGLWTTEPSRPPRGESRRFLPQPRREEHETFLNPGEVRWLLEMTVVDGYAFHRPH